MAEFELPGNEEIKDANKHHQLLAKGGTDRFDLLTVEH